MILCILALECIVSYQQDSEVTTNDNVNDDAECKIYSDPHRQYLHAKFKLFGWSRSIGMWNEGHDYKTTFDESDPSGVWFFEPVSTRKNTFYIRNSKYSDEYLMGSYTLSELLFKKRHRSVHTQKMTGDSNEELFMWELSRVVEWSTSNVAVYMRNVHLDQYLRTRMHYSSLSNNDNKKLSSEMSLLVGLSQEVRPYNEEFDWFLVCRNKILPKII